MSSSSSNSSSSSSSNSSNSGETRRRSRSAWKKIVARSHSDLRTEVPTKKKAARTISVAEDSSAGPAFKQFFAKRGFPSF